MTVHFTDGTTISRMNSKSFATDKDLMCFYSGLDMTGEIVLIVNMRQVLYIEFKESKHE